MLYKITKGRVGTAMICQLLHVSVLLISLGSGSSAAGWTLEKSISGNKLRMTAEKKNEPIYRIVSFLIVLFLTAGFCSAGAFAQSTGEEMQNTESIQIETVKTDTFTMDYFKFGHGEKTFVILPGLSVQSVMGSADAVADAYQLLTDDYTVYVFDRRKELPDHYTVHEIAQDTAEAFLALGLDHIALFGASQGGMIAMEIAVTHPELINKLVICSTTAHVTDEQYQGIEKWSNWAKKKDAKELYMAFGETVYPSYVFDQYREFLIDAASTVTDDEMDRFVILAEGMKDFDVTGDIQKIACPVLVIGDNTDRVLGAGATIEIGEFLKDHSGFEMYLYDGYGHAVYDTAPDFKERILCFLRQGSE